MSDSSAAAWLASTASATPRLSQRLSELGALREARLWHQVTVAIEGLIREPELRWEMREEERGREKGRR